MFELAPREVHVDGLRLRGGQRAFGERDVGLGRHAGAELCLRELQGLAIGLDGARIKRLLAIQDAQLQVVVDHAGLHGKPRGGQVGGAGLGAVGGGLHAAAHAAPEVGLPRRIDRPGVAVAQGAAAAADGARALGRGAGAHDGKVGRLRALYQGLGRAVLGLGLRQRLVGGIGLFEQRVQAAVAVGPPPGLVGVRRAGHGRAPGAVFLERSLVGGVIRGRRADVVRPHGAAGQGAGDEQTGPCEEARDAAPPPSGGLYLENGHGQPRWSAHCRNCRVTNR